MFVVIVSPFYIQWFKVRDDCLLSLYLLIIFSDLRWEVIVCCHGISFSYSVNIIRRYNDNKQSPLTLNNWILKGDTMTTNNRLWPQITEYKKEIQWQQTIASHLKSLNTKMRYNDNKQSPLTLNHWIQKGDTMTTNNRLSP